MPTPDGAFVAFAVNVAPGFAVSARHYPADPAHVTGTVLALAHGAGAGQASAFMVEYATGLARRGIDVVTFDFPYMEARRRVPDPNARLEAAWCAVLEVLRATGGTRAAGSWAGSLAACRLFIGGKSMGGRIASQVAAKPEACSDAGIAGLVFLGYPLHPPGRPDQRRDAHLSAVARPMLFVQGEHDAFGDAEEMRALVAKLPSAELVVVPAANHSLEAPARGAVRLSHADLQETIARWIGRVTGAARQG